jgi:hypothetical protein
MRLDQLVGEGGSGTSLGYPTRATHQQREHAHFGASTTIVEQRGAVASVPVGTCAVDSALGLGRAARTMQRVYARMTVTPAAAYGAIAPSATARSTIRCVSSESGAMTNGELVPNLSAVTRPTTSAALSIMARLR